MHHQGTIMHQTRVAGKVRTLRCKTPTYIAKPSQLMQEPKLLAREQSHPREILSPDWMAFELPKR